MRKVILTSHGHLAEGMQSAVNMILGCQADLEVYDLDHYDEPDMILERVRKRVEEQPNDEFIILTDINNGSVHHQMMQLCLCPNVYVKRACACRWSWKFYWPVRRRGSRKR